MSIGVRGLGIAVREATGIEPPERQVRTTLAAVGIGIVAVFVVLPGLVAGVWSGVLGDVVEAAARAAMLGVYLVVVSRTEAARRLFAYHGAEHQVIAAFETTGKSPSLEQARAQSPIHVRCGTSFIALFVVVAGIVHAFVPREALWAGAMWRAALTAVDAAIAYEIMRAVARRSGAVWARFVTWPGRTLQRLTTRTPSDDQLEVALAALRTLGP